VGGDGNMVAFNVLWKMMVGMGALGLGLAGILYAGQLDMDEDKLDKEIFTHYRDEHTKQTETYRQENNESHVRIAEVVGEIQGDVREIKTILERMDRE
jgi:hypothetical protein